MKFNNYPHSDLYRNFRHIRRDDVYAQIRFYEKYADDLIVLSSEEHFTICCYYANALFAAEDYGRYLIKAPEILERSIIENIRYIDDIDVYIEHLEKMSMAYLKLKDFDNALKIAVQLYNISGREKKYKILLKKILKSQRPKIILELFAVSICLALLWTILEISNLLVLETFYNNTSLIIDYLQMLTIFCLLSSSTLAFFGHYIYVNRRLIGLIK